MLDKTNANQNSKSKMQAGQNTTYQLSIWKHHHKYISNITSPAIIEDIEPNIQMHAKTQPEKSRLVDTLFLSKEWK